MTCREFYNEVAQLGFENAIDEESTFYPALNTALHSVLREVPMVKSAILAHTTLNPLVSDTNLTIHGGEGIFFKTEGAKSFYIELSGVAEISFKMYAENKIEIPHNLDFKNDRQGYKVTRCFLVGNGGIIPHTVEVSVSAITLCKLKAIALYGEVTSDKTEDIQSPTGYVEYDLRDVCEKFGALYYPPKYEGGITLSDYVIEGEKLSLPRDTDGDIVLAYTPAIPRYSEDAEGEIAIPDNCIGALKYLVASLVWLDDNASRAQYYKALYNEELINIKRTHRDLNPIKHESVNNW